MPTRTYRDRYTGGWQRAASMRDTTALLYITLIMWLIPNNATATSHGSRTLDGLAR